MLDINSTDELHDVRTVGTWQFMACGVQAQQWSYEPPKIDFKNEPPWRQHALHDLEPIYWTAVWIIFSFVVPGVVLRPKYDLQQNYHSLFPLGSVRRELRQMTLVSAIRYGLPEEYFIFVQDLHDWCGHLRDQYAHVYINAYRGMKLADLGKESMNVIQESIRTLGNMRSLAVESPILSQDVKNVRMVMENTEDEKKQTRRR
ncbi:hypothetical protein E1B28_008268 [Marasmius oreades]|uniref:Uncharacterized protein n=1 Tax=Marasmius oreades TaxID=181124 RepID=A0A9P7RYQ1_9AGAR|nr:uncharacterized protein E1B28_008268 [Marasmius oreades]KAG7091867.1 hypothetical protein E1B28_008268 [Marasmius oreades]